MRSDACPLRLPPGFPPPPQTSKQPSFYVMQPISRFLCHFDLFLPKCPSEIKIRVWRKMPGPSLRGKVDGGSPGSALKKKERKKSAKKLLFCAVKFRARLFSGYERRSRRRTRGFLGTTCPAPVAQLRSFCSDSSPELAPINRHQTPRFSQRHELPEPVPSY